MPNKRTPSKREIAANAKARGGDSEYGPAIVPRHVPPPRPVAARAAADVFSFGLADHLAAHAQRVAVKAERFGFRLERGLSDDSYMIVTRSGETAMQGLPDKIEAWLDAWAAARERD